MESKKTKEVLDEHAARRRALLKNAGRVAITAPAVSLLLSQGMKPALAQSYGDNGPGGKITDVTAV
jgi:hypothetical protein